MKLSGNFYISYKTHNFCSKCDNGHKSGWIPKEDCPGIRCPKCGFKLRKKPKFNKTNWQGGRY